MNKWIIYSVLLLVVFTSPAFAADTTTEQIAYWELLAGKLFNLGLLISILASLFLLLLGGVYLTMQVVDKDSLAKRDLKPMTALKFVGIMCLASVMYMPISAIVFLNDISGLAPSDSSDMDICLVNDVSISNYTWTNSASDCLTEMEEKIKSLTSTLDDEHLDAANLPLLLKVMQTVCLGFFVSSCIVLGKHMLGYRNVKLSASSALLAMFVSAVLFASPNLIDYWNDISGGTDEEIISAS